MRYASRLCALSVLFAVIGQAGAFAAPPRSTSLHSVQDDTRVSVFRADAPVLQYRWADVPYKPYVEKFYSPGGVNILRDSPHDHKHHHALMFAVTVDGVDFWIEHPRRKPGSQVHRDLEVGKGPTGPRDSRAVIDGRLDWLSADKTPLLAERRTITVYPADDLKASLLTWQSHLEPADGKKSVELTGSHYFGLGMRFVESMDHDGRFFNAGDQKGSKIRRKERLTKTKWMAYVAPVEGKTVTVAMFDHPSNPRHPARMFTMPEHFAYISATLNLWKQPLVIEAGRPLVLRYGVALWDGEVDAAAVEQVYRRWAQLSVAKPNH